MKQIGGHKEDNCLYVLFNVVNIGKADTTITHAVLYGYSGWFTKFINKHKVAALVTNGILGYTIPYVLKPGHVFSEAAIQTKNIEEWSRQLKLYGGGCSRIWQETVIGEN